MTGVSKGEVSRICAELDEMVEQFRSRKLSGSYPYVWLDATYIMTFSQSHYRVTVSQSGGITKNNPFCLNTAMI